MKSFIFALATFSLSIAALSATVRRALVSEIGQASSPPAQENSTGRAPVVVELFTSEGCSSCPPADALLARLAAQQPVAGAEVLALEEHVDYWNHLGWADPFSSREFTARQEAYEQRFDAGSVYTPQMVVDGHTELVGSQEWRARQSIAQAAQQTKTPVKLAAVEGRVPIGALQVSVGRLSGAAAGDKVEVFLAITEAGLHSAVTRGENAGEDLHHSPIVRVLRKIGDANPQKDTAFSASPSLNLATSWKRENLHAVVFIQEQKSRRILGAASIPLA